MRFFSGKGKLYRQEPDGWQEFQPGQGWSTSFHAEGQVLNFPGEFEEIAAERAFVVAEELESK